MKNISMEEIERLNRTVLARDEEIAKLNKHSVNWKTILTVVAIVCSLIYYIKVRDEELNQFNVNAIKDLETKDNEINALNKELETNRKTLKSVSNDLKNKNLIISDLNNDLEANRRQSKTFEQTIGDKDKQITDLLNEIQSRDAENDRLVNRLNHNLMITAASNGSAEVLYSSNKTVADVIISLAKESLTDENLITCSDDPTAKFNVYRNCFRDLSIILHNRLHKELGPQWAVTTGSVDNCFSINVIDDTQREEYFFTLEDIYFEIFRFSQNVTIAKKMD